jgi:Bacterial Ig-like domain (group 2)
MMHRTVASALIVVGAAAAVFACGRDQGPVGVRCGDVTVPGVLVMPPGIQVALRNAQGQPAALGASMTALNASQAPTPGYVADSLTLDANVPAGTYSVRLAKPAYRDTTIANVVVLTGDCGLVQPTKLAVTLQPLGGATSVRSVGVAGTTFLATPGSQVQLVAIVDADPGLSHAVTWRVNDTTMATVDRSGLVTAKCSMSGGTVAVTATSVGNGDVSASATFGVGAAESCDGVRVGR